MHTAPTNPLGPTVAGSWYPADAEKLRAQIDGFHQRVEHAGPGAGTLRALIAPHAGFVYSGQVAAHGFDRLGTDRHPHVLLLGPSHYAAFEGAAVPAASSYRTPLGEIPIDADSIDALRLRPGVRVDDGPFRPEHCLEAEIPFLQRRFTADWKLLPVLIGRIPSADLRRSLADGLRSRLAPETLVVISSDFTHYGPRFDYVPFRHDVPERIEQLDMGAVERILAWDLSGFETYVEKTGATICGRNAIRLLLELFPDGLPGKLAAYDTSGSITGDWDHSVSYASLVFETAA